VGYFGCRDNDDFDIWYVNFLDKVAWVIHHLISPVIQEAYRSRYKSAMHIRAFDKAVKRYRQHVAPVSGNRGRRLHLTPVPADPSLHSQGKARSASCSSSVFNLSQAQAAADRQHKRISDSHKRAQESLEALPGHVLQHAKTFHTYIRLFVDDANILDSQNGGNGNPVASGGMAEVSGALRKLLDEIAILGNIGKARKEEILQDPDARHVNLAYPFSRFYSTYFVPIDFVRVKYRE
jgi:potassium channel subfamily K, other eukaryote